MQLVRFLKPMACAEFAANVDQTLALPDELAAALVADGACVVIADVVEAIAEEVPAEAEPPKKAEEQE